MLLQKIKDLRISCSQSEYELVLVKRELQFTRLAEMKTENELCINEMVRLR